MKEEQSDHSFCESVHAGSVSKWHIRRLSEAGFKLGGGIDTPTLCGKTMQGWDINVKIDVPCSDCMGIGIIGDMNSGGMETCTKCRGTGRRPEPALSASCKECRTAFENEVLGSSLPEGKLNDVQEEADNSLIAEKTMYHKGWINLTREELEDLRIVVSYIPETPIGPTDRGRHVRISDRMLRKVRASRPNVEYKLELEEEKEE